MIKKSMMSFSTIKTVLNTAPIVIQGATHLVKLIRARGEHEQHEQTEVATTDVENEIMRLKQRLDANDESSVAQIKLIEELAKQNELLAVQLKKIMMYQYSITLLVVSVMMIAIVFFSVN